MAEKTPAHLFIPDPTPDPDFTSDDHRRVMARCNRGHGISFGNLAAVLANDPFTYGINHGDEMKLGQILGELVANGDLVQLEGGFFEATEDGWEKVTHYKANGGK